MHRVIKNFQQNQNIESVMKRSNPGHNCPQKAKDIIVHHHKCTKPVIKRKESNFYQIQIMIESTKNEVFGIQLDLRIGRDSRR